MNRDLTPEEQEQVREAIAGIDNAMAWMDADVRRLQRALDAGIPWEVVTELNRILYRAGE